jgi:hypothetical protein
MLLAEFDIPVLGLLAAEMQRKGRDLIVLPLSSERDRDFAI